MFGNDFGWDLPPGCSHDDIDEALGVTDVGDEAGDDLSIGQLYDVFAVVDYHYTGTAPLQIGNNRTPPYTAHDDIKLTDGPLY